MIPIQNISELFILDHFRGILEAWAAFACRSWNCVENSLQGFTWHSLFELTTYDHVFWFTISIYFNLLQSGCKFLPLALSSGDVGWKIYASPIRLLTTAVAGRKITFLSHDLIHCNNAILGSMYIGDIGIQMMIWGLWQRLDPAKVQHTEHTGYSDGILSVPKLRQVDPDGEHWNSCAQTAAANRHRTCQLPFTWHDHSFDSIDSY